MQKLSLKSNYKILFLLLWETVQFKVRVSGSVDAIHEAKTFSAAPYELQIPNMLKSAICLGDATVGATTTAIEGS